jgi:hypothetical protein
MELPGDVAIRTTSHQGTRVAIIHAFGAWIEAAPLSPGIVGEAMLDVADISSRHLQSDPRIL